MICFPLLLFGLPQIDHHAQKDLKIGLQLFGTEGNIGLTNAWSIVQTDVSPIFTPRHLHWEGLAAGKQMDEEVRTLNHSYVCQETVAEAGKSFGLLLRTL